MSIFRGRLGRQNFIFGILVTWALTLIVWLVFATLFSVTMIQPAREKARDAKLQADLKYQETQQALDESTQ